MLPDVKVFTRDNPCTKKEEWRAVVGYEGLYRVSDRGRVMSLPTKYHPRITILKPWFQTEQRYAYVTLWDCGGRKARSVHSLVADAFLGPRPTGLLVLHNDGVGSHNAVDNLRYGTQSENMHDRKAHGTEVTPSAKLSRRQVCAIRNLLASGAKVRSIAELYGVTPENVYLIRAGKTWRI